MRIIAYILETLTLAFIITAFIFISKQEHVDEVKVKQEADSSANAGLDRLNNILEDDTAATRPDTTKAL